MHGAVGGVLATLSGSGLGSTRCNCRNFNGVLVYSGLGIMRPLLLWHFCRSGRAALAGGPRCLGLLLQPLTARYMHHGGRYPRLVAEATGRTSGLSWAQQGVASTILYGDALCAADDSASVYTEHG